MLQVKYRLLLWPLLRGQNLCDIVAIDPRVIKGNLLEPLDMLLNLASGFVANKHEDFVHIVAELADSTQKILVLIDLPLFAVEPGLHDLIIREVELLVL